MTDSRLRGQQRRAARDPGEGARLVRLTCRAEGHAWATPPTHWYPPQSPLWRLASFDITPRDWEPSHSYPPMSREPYKPRVDLCTRCGESFVRPARRQRETIDPGQRNTARLLSSLMGALYEEAEEIARRTFGGEAGESLFLHGNSTVSLGTIRYQDPPIWIDELRYPKPPTVGWSEQPPFGPPDLRY